MRYATSRWNPSGTFRAAGDMLHMLLPNSSLAALLYNCFVERPTNPDWIILCPSTVVFSSNLNTLPEYHYHRKPINYPGIWTPQPCPTRCRMQSNHTQAHMWSPWRLRVSVNLASSAAGPSQRDLLRSRGGVLQLCIGVWFIRIKKLLQI